MLKIKKYFQKAIRLRFIPCTLPSKVLLKKCFQTTKEPSFNDNKSMKYLCVEFKNTKAV